MLGEIKHWRRAHQRRTNGDTGRRTDRQQAAPGNRRDSLERLQLRSHFRQCLAQRFDRFTQTTLQCSANGRQRTVGNRRFSAEFEHLATPRTQRQQATEALGRDPGARIAKQAHADIPSKTLRQLAQHLGRTRVQAMGIEQRHTEAGPVRRHLTAQCLDHLAAVAGFTEGRRAATDQYIAQTLQRLTMRFALAGQAKQTTQRLTAKRQRLCRGDEGQTRPLDAGLAVQPPQAVAQRQRLATGQPEGKTAARATGLAQQTRALPEQFVEIFGRLPQRHQLAVQRQRLRRALQQLENLRRLAGLTQRLAQVALAQCAGQQLQQMQVFVGLRGDGDGQVHLLAIAPVHPIGELDQADAGAQHLIAGLRRAMGDGDALAEKGRALGFTRLQALEVSRIGQAGTGQRITEHGQGFALVRRNPAHLDLAGIEFEHGGLRLVVLAKTSR